ncbi:MAG TPA: class I SAM-dependent methyltransferase [Stellaceae bacterium]|nr:class I SAM-dependent methyltransferase [Stellaceae bacterium]
MRGRSNTTARERDVRLHTHPKTSLVERMNWQPVHGASSRIDDDGLLVLGDGACLDYHLLRWIDRRANGARVNLKMVAKPADGCNTNLYVHHWGHQDICSMSKDGTVVFDEGAEMVRVQPHADGFFEVDVTFQNRHETLSIGMGKPCGQYQGTGTDQYIFKSIEVELLPLNAVRHMLVEKLWRGSDPFQGFSANLFEYDLQGWASQHAYLVEAIDLLRPSVIVEVGVWKGGSTVYMAQAAKKLGLTTVVIAVDTWLGSSEHWLNSDFFSEMSFISGYPALFQKFMSNVIRSEVSDHVLPIPIASIGAAQILSSLGVAPEVIHLDAAHDYDSVTADLRSWWPALAPGGLLIGDDYPGWTSVQRAFDDFFGALGLTPLENDGTKCRVRKPAE